MAALNLVLSADWGICPGCSAQVPVAKLRCFDRPLLPEVEKRNNVVLVSEWSEIRDHECMALAAVRAIEAEGRECLP